jgi:hypothetical protein
VLSDVTGTGLWLLKLHHLQLHPLR